MKTMIPALFNGISFQLAKIGILCALLLSIILGCIQLYVDFQNEKVRIHSLVNDVIHVTTPPAIRSVATLDTDLSNELVSGLLSYGFIYKVSIFDESGFVLATGTTQREVAVEHWLAQLFKLGNREYITSLPLAGYTDGTAGKLVLTVDGDKALEGFFERAKRVMLIILLQNIALVSIFFIIYYFKFTKPLVELTREVQSIDPDEPGVRRLTALSKNRKDELPQLIGSINHLLDVVENSLKRRNDIEFALRCSEEHLREIIDSLPVLVGARNRDGYYVFANKALTSTLGFSVDSMRNIPTRELLKDLVPDVERMLANDLVVIESERELPAFEERLVTASGKELILQTHMMPFNFYDEVISLIVCVDITDRKHAQARMEHMAHHDALTGLPNRLQLVERLTHELCRAQRRGYFGAILFIDLDQFKTINDSLGHPVGDRVLKVVASRLRASLREEDLVARLSGDEFVVVLTALEQDQILAEHRALELSETIRTLISQPFQHESMELRVTCSVGVVIYPESDKDVDELLRHADTAMYQVKEKGRNAIEFFNEEMAAKVNRLLEMERDLHRAIEEQQFELYFQPKLDVLTNRVVGAEALLRWRHPEKGMIPPSEFISVLEASGLIIQVGHWVIEESCKRLVEWGRRGIWTSGMRLSLNISPRQFRRDEFVEDVLNLLSVHPIPYQSLDMEITEGIVISRVDDAISTMNALIEHGVSFSLDDFGTGYSSISYLKRLPVQTLKIDQSFVRDLIEDRSDRVLVETIITMGNLLDMELVAEGVETEEQLDVLRAFGCHYYQGYLFSAAISAQSFETILEKSTNFATY